MAECGYNSARDIGGHDNPIPAPEPYLMPSAPSVKAETTADDLEDTSPQPRRTARGS